jgi:hypothetical protein
MRQSFLAEARSPSTAPTDLGEIADGKQVQSRMSREPEFQQIFAQVMSGPVVVSGSKPQFALRRRNLNCRWPRSTLISEVTDHQFRSPSIGKNRTA